MTRRQAAGLLLAAFLLAGGRLARHALLVDGTGAWRDPLFLDRFLPPDETAAPSPDGAAGPTAAVAEVTGGPGPAVDSAGGAAGPIGRAGRTARAVAFAGVLDINRAPPDSLVLLPGIGPALAARIAADRAARGPYRAPADRERVKGIGPRLAARLAPRLRFATPSPSPPNAVSTTGSPARP